MDAQVVLLVSIFHKDDDDVNNCWVSTVIIHRRWSSGKFRGNRSRGCLQCGPKDLRQLFPLALIPQPKTWDCVMQFTVYGISKISRLNLKQKNYLTRTMLGFTHVTDGTNQMCKQHLFMGW